MNLKNIIFGLGAAYAVYYSASAERVVFKTSNPRILAHTDDDGFIDLYSLISEFFPDIAVIFLMNGSQWSAAELDKAIWAQFSDVTYKGDRQLHPGQLYPKMKLLEKQKLIRRAHKNGSQQLYEINPNAMDKARRIAERTVMILRDIGKLEKLSSFYV